MPVKKLTHIEFLKSLKLKNITFITKYDKATTKIKCLCDTCGYTWSALPGNLKAGKGCSSCAGNLQVTNLQFLDEMKHRKITFLSRFVSNKTPISCLCDICNHNWVISPKKLRSGTGCPKCGGSMRSTQAKLVEVLSGRKITILSGYINNKTKVKCLCTTCEFIWQAAPNKLISGRGCPQCGRNNLSEQMIRDQVIERYGERYKIISNDRNTIMRNDGIYLELDIYIPEIEYAIEYNGIQHYKPIKRWGGNASLEKIKISDNYKLKFCKNNNIRLDIIKYDQISINSKTHTKKKFFSSLFKSIDKHLLDLKI